MKKLLAAVVVLTTAAIAPLAGAESTSVQIVRTAGPTLTVNVLDASYGIGIAAGGGAALTSTLKPLFVRLSLGTAPTYSAQLDGGTVVALTGVSIDQKRPADTATGQATGRRPPMTGILRRHGSKADDWRSWASSFPAAGGGTKSISIKAHVGGKDVREYAATTCTPAFYELTANADGSVDEALTVSCGGVTLTGGPLAQLFADLVAARPLTKATVSTAGRSYALTSNGANATNAVTEYNLADGVERFGMQFGAIAPPGTL